MAFALVSVALTAVGPKILGRATDLIFSGLFSKQIPANLTQEQAVAGMRAQRGDHSPTCSRRWSTSARAGRRLRPSAGPPARPRPVCRGEPAVSGRSPGSSCEVVNRSVYRLRRDVEAKLGRLPLSYFDSQPRGELLSRVTNDIDNVAQSLQQTLSQLLTSLLTVIAMLAMMFSSPRCSRSSPS
jgi:ATP-binding cassette subfamily B multidrug efflux pump